MRGRIVIVSGPPGAGKSTIAERLAVDTPANLTAHLHSDDFYNYVCKGSVAPWLAEARPQNIVIMEALIAAAASFACGGYEVIVDGIVGPWFIDPWLAVARKHRLDLRYVVLMPSEAATIARATLRTAPGSLTDPVVVQGLWRRFHTFAPLAENLVDTTRQRIEETATAVRDGLTHGRFVLAWDRAA
ncbi:AAA family ATPase [Phenylobacterium sp.]|uniref:AAA family ATPase n=1 Tax=Phenylobacterium sp. TaxID=1871053 RepID=UPI002B60C7D4|nr:AAA family ATPase [Phenylobacterium sp.]HLZ75860.1 AAA family ATPase [Phenylobacterium sp.]